MYLCFEVGVVELLEIEDLGWLYDLVVEYCVVVDL